MINRKKLIALILLGTLLSVFIGTQTALAQEPNPDLIINPSSGDVGTEVIIHAHSFSSWNTLTVQFGGVTVEPIDTYLTGKDVRYLAIVVNVPNLPSGPCTVSVTEDRVTESTIFTVTKPTEPDLTFTIAPSSGDVGTKAIIHAPSITSWESVTVQFGEVTVEPIRTWLTGKSPDQHLGIEVNVPDLPPDTYTVSVTVDGRTGSISFTVTITTNPRIEILPSSGTAGTSIKITAIDYTTPGTPVIKFNDVAVLTTSHGSAGNGVVVDLDVPDMVPGPYTVSLTMGDETESNSFTIDPIIESSSPWDHLTQNHNDPDSFGALVQSFDSDLAGLFQQGGSIYTLVAETNSYTDQIDWTDIARLEAELLEVKVLCQDIDLGVSEADIQGILDAIDALQIQSIIDVLSDETRYVDDAEYLELLTRIQGVSATFDDRFTFLSDDLAILENYVATGEQVSELKNDVKNILDAIDTLPVQSIMDVLNDENRFVDDAEYMELLENIQTQSDIVSDKFADLGIDVDSRFASLMDNLANLESQVATEQQVLELKNDAQDILDAIDGLQVQSILDALNDNTRYVDDVEYLELLGKIQTLSDTVNVKFAGLGVNIDSRFVSLSDDLGILESHLATAQQVSELKNDVKEVLDAIDALPVQSIMDVLNDEARFVDDAEYMELLAKIQTLSDTVSDKFAGLGVDVDSGFVSLMDNLANLESQVATGEQIFEFKQTIMGILGNADNFVSDLELEANSVQVIEALSAEMDIHETNLASKIDALDWETIYGIQTDVHSIQNTIVDQNIDLVSRMEALETQLLEIPVNSIRVQIESADSNTYYILTTLNGKPTEAELSITVSGTPINAKDYSVSSVSPGLYNLEFKGKAGKNKDPILVVAWIDVDGTSIYASAIKVLQ